jgi:hypothetical protein
MRELGSSLPERFGRSTVSCELSLPDETIMRRTADQPTLRDDSVFTFACRDAAS